MDSPRIHRVSHTILTALSFAALLAVLSGYTQPPQADEGAAAHIFQLSIAALLPAVMIFVVTADGKRPVSSLWPLSLPALVVAVAFAALYYLEHYR